MSNFRITHRTLHRSSLDGLERNLAKMQQLQGRLSSGREVAKPSDSPVAVVSAMQLRSASADVEQYVRNANDGRNWLGAADDTLTQVLGDIRRVRELAARGLNSSMGADARAAMASEVETLREGLLALANTRYLDRPIFAGTAAASRAYDVDGTYLGDVGDEAAAATMGKVQREVAQGVTVRVNVTGPEVFGPGAGDLFAAVDRVALKLRDDPGALAEELDALDAHSVQVGNQLAKIGARYHQVEAMTNRAQDDMIALRRSLSEVEDVDLPKTIVDLQLQEVSYQAALSATSRVIQPSLLDFLR